MKNVGTIVCTLVLGGVLLAFFVEQTDAQTYRGNTMTVRRYRTYYRSYCVCWYRWWGCSAWRYRWYTYYYYQTICATGWTHNGDYYCNVPVCRPRCLNRGRCTNPNTCSCPSTSTGPFCGDLTCSYERPCYPGDCVGGTTCECDDRFLKVNNTHGCTKFNDPSLEPFLSKSLVTLANVRRDNNKTNFMFILDGTNRSNTEVVWSNQKEFNTIKFEMNSTFDQPPDLPERVNYVHDARMGIVNSRISGRISSIPRGTGNYVDDGKRRDLGWNQSYSCSHNGWSKDNPAVEISVCEVYDDQFKTAIEHGDWMTLIFQTSSGGFQKLVNIDQASRPYATRYYEGYDDVKQVRFKFDFFAPKHCSEPDANSTCPNDAAILEVEEEFTKNPIKPRWRGWVDDLSGVWEYYVEVFRLRPNAYGQLLETTPINPEFSQTIVHGLNIPYPEYRPSEPGMYSVLMETRDTANNSRTSRRFVLFDDQSHIEINTNADGGLYVSSAVAETGYSWQTTATAGDSITFALTWSNHFINRIHEDGKLLNEIKPYPIQFKEIQDNGILFSEKYVNASLDAPLTFIAGQRTRSAIPNHHGIVKFETGYVLQSSNNPPERWTELTPLAEKKDIELFLVDGNIARLWVRATDIMGHQVTDKTIVGVDRSPPTITNGPGAYYQHGLTKNIEDGSYTFTSNVEVSTSDIHSGVFRIDLRILMTIKGVEYEHATWSANATMAEPDTPGCTSVIGEKCFIHQQSINIDNCRFMVNKTALNTATARLEVSGVNQALLKTSTFFNVGKVNELKGLEKYSGPKNIRVAQTFPNGFQLKWDLPEHPSCYGIADIVIIVVKKDAAGNDVFDTYSTFGTATHMNILDLEPKKQYRVQFSVKGVDDATTELNAETSEEIQAEGMSVGATVGLVIGLLIVFGLVIAVLFVLMRRGVIHPRERAQQIKRAVTVKARTMKRRTAGGFHNAYDRQSDLYTYGGMDMPESSAWHLDRNDVVFESLLKSGRFANVYNARLRGHKSGVVAKTLKEQFSKDDEMLMTAKMNFTGKVVGDHPNLLRFLGGVVSDSQMGPFIIYERCENGVLRDYLVSMKSDVTMELQENLFRFGLEIAKGMEFLAQKKIVHRRLAARNILLTYMNEVKIYGFGPQPTEEDGGDAESGKKERIPIKWMAPECMKTTKDATEKSDVWSYGVVLWEIFSLGDTPFDNIRSQDMAARVKKGERLAKPEQCDDTWYNIMNHCWAYEARKRKKFSEIREELEGMFVTASGDDHYYYDRS